MKFLRSLMGALFVLALAVFLATTFVRQGLLSEKTWLAALNKSNIVNQLEDFLVTNFEKKVGAAAAEKLRGDLRLEEFRQVMEGNVVSLLAFVRGEQEQVVFDLGQAGTYDVTATAAKNPQVAAMLIAVRFAYRVITITWMAAGAVTVLALLVTYATGERGQRLSPVAAYVIAGGIVSLVGAGLVYGVGKKLAGGATFPIEIAGEVIRFDISSLINALITTLVTPIVATGTGLAAAGGILLLLARRREPKVAAVKPPATKTGRRLNKKALVGIIVLIVLGIAGYYAKQNILWSTFHSQDYGYKLSLPPHWKIDESASSATNRETTVIHPDELAFVTIKAIKDESLQEPGAVEAALKQRVEGFAAQPNMTVTQSSANVEGGLGGYMVEGTEIIQGKTWNFHERGLIDRTGKALLFHGAADPSLGADYTKTLGRIIESFGFD